MGKKQEIIKILEEVTESCRRLQRTSDARIAEILAIVGKLHLELDALERRIDIRIE